MTYITIILYVYTIYTAPVTIVIGFAESEYTVAEDQSFVEVTVSVLDGDLDSVEDNVIVELSTSDISQGEL